MLKNKIEINGTEIEFYDKQAREDIKQVLEAIENGELGGSDESEPLSNLEIENLINNIL